MDERLWIIQILSRLYNSFLDTLIIQRALNVWSVGAPSKDIRPNWWATFCRAALKHLRNILFILQQSGICFCEWMTCVIQGVLQVFGLHHVFIKQTDTGINRKNWLQNVVQEWDKPSVILSYSYHAKRLLPKMSDLLAVWNEGDRTNVFSNSESNMAEITFILRWH